MRKFSSASLVLLLLAAAPQDDGLQVGFGAADITPAVEPFDDENLDGRYTRGEPFEDKNGDERWTPVWMAGFGTGRAASGVHDPLWSRCLAIKQGRTIVLLLSLDLVGVLNARGRALRAKVAEATGVPVDHIIVAGTHNHAGPDVLGLWGPLPGVSGVDDAYLKLLEERVVESAKKALETLLPSKLEAVAAPVEKGILKDVRDPKVMNETATTLAFTGGRTRLLVNFAMHPEGMGSKNLQITSDYPHYLRRALEPADVLFVSADLGGMQTPDVKGHTWAEIERVGRGVAKAAQAERSPVKIGALRVRRQEVLFGLENPKFVFGMKHGLFGDPKDSVEEKDGKYRIRSEVTAVRLGEDALLVTVPGEAFPEVGKKIYERMNAKYKILIGLGNDEVGYIVPRDAWNEKGYEESMSLGPGTEAALLDAVDRLLKGF